MCIASGRIRKQHHVQAGNIIKKLQVEPADLCEAETMLKGSGSQVRFENKPTGEPFVFN